VTTSLATNCSKAIQGTKLSKHDDDDDDDEGDVGLINQSINQSLLRQKAAHAETRNKNKHKRQTKLTAMK